MLSTVLTNPDLLAPLAPKAAISSVEPKTLIMASAFLYRRVKVLHATLASYGIPPRRWQEAMMCCSIMMAYYLLRSHYVRNWPFPMAPSEEEE